MQPTMSFGNKTKCEQCATPYLLYKFLLGNVLHGDMKRLTLDDWKEKYKDKIAIPIISYSIAGLVGLSRIQSYWHWPTP